MILLPAIDLRNKKAVRLIQGDFKQETIYSDDPVSIALAFEQAGATNIHIVDLNGADAGEMVHESIIQDIVLNTGLSVEIGGGVRTLARVKQLIELGVKDVIVGSIAVENVQLLEEMVRLYPNQIIVSIDSKDGYVLTRGWKETSKLTTLAFAKSLEKIGVTKIVYTDVSKDGMLAGPNFEDYELLLNETSLNVIASGGVTSLQDIQRLKQMGLYGAIIGKALYENKLDLKEALQCLQNESSRV